MCMKVCLPAYCTSEFGANLAMSKKKTVVSTYARDALRNTELDCEALRTIQGSQVREGTRQEKVPRIQELGVDWKRVQIVYCACLSRPLSTFLMPCHGATLYTPKLLWRACMLAASPRWSAVARTCCTFMG